MSSDDFRGFEINSLLSETKPGVMILKKFSIRKFFIGGIKVSLQAFQ